MEEFEIFSQFLMAGNNTDSLFVRLGCDQDIGLRQIQPVNMEIVEMFSTVSPAVAFEFVDGNGDFVNHIKPSPSTTFFLDIGKDVINSTRIELKLSKTVMLNKRAGAAEQIAFKMFFAHKTWSEMTNIRYNRAWVGKKHSEVVDDILTTAGVTMTDISVTTSGEPVTIQPYWDNITMLSNIQSAARTANGGHTEFGMRINGEFIFKSTGDMIVEQRVDAIAGRLPIIRMEGQIPDETQRESEYKNNYGAPTYFAHFTGTERYMDAVRNGGGGVKAMCYDSINDTLVIRDIKYSETRTIQLSDWAAIQSIHENSGTLVNGGREYKVFDEAVNSVVDVVDSMNSFEVSIEGSPDLHIGSMVEMIIPTPITVDSIVPSNLLYSGFYLISGVQHKITFKTSRMNTTIFLMREGFDSKDLVGYIKSITGKFV